MKKLICAALCLVLLTSPVYAIDSLSGGDIGISAPSAVLMEKVTGQVIYEKSPHERLAPASVTKVMTMLLIVEAIERGEMSLDDTVTASERAASFGGSCVYLEQGEKMSVGEMLKCICVVSANDCAVAMAEHMCGTEQAFVSRMNGRARELGLEDTHFENCTGLFDDDGHYTSAYDVAVMSRELIRHDMIKQYSTIWIDSIRGGRFGLSNTNKLVYYYDGCTGLKTGFTEKAMYCLSATAERDGVEYIAVVMHAASSDARNSDAMALLSYAFANYRLLPLRSPDVLPPVRVSLGEADSVQPVYDGAQAALVPKSGTGEVSYDIQLPDSVAAPVASGQRLGTLSISSGGRTLFSVPLVSDCAVGRAGFASTLLELLKGYVMQG